MSRQWWTPETPYADVYAGALKYPSWHSESCLCLRCLAQDWVSSQVGGTRYEAREVYRRALRARPPDHGGTLEDVRSVLGFVFVTDIEALPEDGSIQQSQTTEYV